MKFGIRSGNLHGILEHAFLIILLEAKLSINYEIIFSMNKSRQGWDRIRNSNFSFRDLRTKLGIESLTFGIWDRDEKFM